MSWRKDKMYALLYTCFSKRLLKGGGEMFSYKNRSENIERLKNEQFDVLIIGGGITGAGLALQTAASGMKTALVEMQDFSEGTSSRSTKLVHGGIRYLKTFDVEVVSDTVGERAVVQRIAPHIPRADPMLLPIYDEPGTTFTMFSVKVAMDLYDHLAGITDGPWKNYLITREEVLDREPQIKAEGLQGGGVYLDYRNNDARLVIENIKKAVEDGAVISSRLKVEEILHDTNQKVNGALVRDRLTNEKLNISAKIVVNTSGPWSDSVRNLDSELLVMPQMRPTKGVHLVVSAQRLKVPQPTYFDTGKQDGRMIFVIPRENKTYFGTTDTDYTGDYAHPEVTKEDVDYLLEVVNNRYPEAKLTLTDIEASWAGLRPLLSDNSSSDYTGGDAGKLTDESFERLKEIMHAYETKKADRSQVEKTVHALKTIKGETKKNPSAVSRGSSLIVAKDGLITVAGGKLTDYRKMAESAAKEIASRLKATNATIRLIDSKVYPVSGGEFDYQKVEEELARLASLGERYGVDKDDALYLAELYGSNAPFIFENYQELETNEELSLADLYSLHYSLDYEMVGTPVDYLLRRTNHLLFMEDSLEEVKAPVVREMAKYFEWTTEQTQRMYEQLEKQISETRLDELKNKKK